jgi:ankyrin repeat protein
LHTAIKKFPSFSLPLIKFLVASLPWFLLKQDEYGRTPLHIACDFPYVIRRRDVISVLLNRVRSCAFIEDHDGNTPSQLLRRTARLNSVDGSLEMHVLAKQEKYPHTTHTFNLWFRAYPDHLKSPDDFGMLPFHYACLNPSLPVDILMLFVQSNPECVETDDIQRKLPHDIHDYVRRKYNIPDECYESYDDEEEGDDTSDDVEEVNDETSKDIDGDDD